MPNILIVDDDAVDRELAQRCLEPVEDLQLDFARNGTEALDGISKRMPDLVLTDLRMPGMDGLELVGQVQKRFPLLPVILMTSKGSERVAVKALESGAASYVSKSDLQNNLVETVEQVLDVAEARRSRGRILSYLGSSETRFELANDLALVSPLVGFFRESLQRLEFCDDSTRTQIGIAMMEAVNNAIIHGNLEVGSDLRQHDIRSYYRLIEERRHQAPYATRRVRCTARESPGRVEYTVLDEGPGFDPTTLPDPTSPENMERVFGRGLLLIRTFMDNVTFNDVGNRITMTKLDPSAEPDAD